MYFYDCVCVFVCVSVCVFMLPVRVRWKEREYVLLIYRNNANIIQAAGCSYKSPVECF